MSNKAEKIALQTKVNGFLKDKSDTECLSSIIKSFEVNKKFYFF